VIGGRTTGGASKEEAVTIPLRRTKLLIAMCTMAVAALAVSGCTSGPEAGYQKLTEAAEAGDWGQVYDLIDKKSQGQVDMAFRMLAGFATADVGTATAGKSGRDMFIAMLSNNDEAAAQYKAGDYEITGKEVDGEEATLTVRRPDGTTQIVQMLKEDGIWKLSVSDAFGPTADGTPPSDE
jgi:hypothetical protein